MTINGNHTAGELGDLLRAKDVELGDLVAAGDAVRARVSGDAWTDWYADLASYQALYQPIRTTSLQDIAVGDSAWQSTLGAVVQVFGSGDTTPPTERDWNAVLAVLPLFDDLVQRWPTLPGNPTPRYATRPEPQPGAVDDDLNALNTVAKVDVLGNAIDAAKAHPKTSVLVLMAGAVGGAFLLRGIFR